MNITGALVALLALLFVACSNDEPFESSPTPNESSGAAAQFTSGTVVNVVDGVTIDVDVEGTVSRVRYMGLAVPSGDPAPGGQSVAGRALEFNQFLVGGKSVQLERGVPDTDESGHLLRYVYVDGEMVNLALLTNGYAGVSELPAQFERKASFAIAEAGAKQQQRGFWRDESGGGDTESQAVSTEAFTGGTLPALPGLQQSECDFSGTSEAKIKGNINTRTKSRIYHVPGGFFYNTIEVDSDEGDRWFCTEGEAVAAGWTKSTH